MHRTAGSTIIVMAVAFAATCAAGTGIAQTAPVPRDPLITPIAMSRVKATGRGRAPKRAGSDAQLRLMARRAAVVEAYKNAAKTLGQARSTVAAGTGSETVSGFIRGVELTETRYYRDGDVEVDVEFMVPAPPAAMTPSGAPCAEPGSGEGLLMVEKGRGPMPEEEWKEILGGGEMRNP